jgi:hypothetical protein
LIALKERVKFGDASFLAAAKEPGKVTEDAFSLTKPPC